MSNAAAIKRIGICAPSGRMNADTFPAGVQWLQDNGFDVFVHPQCHAEYGQMAGEAHSRAAALMDVLTDPALDAVWLMAGGHRGAELLPLLDWDALKDVPEKPVLGFSDGSIIVNALAAKLGWKTCFAPTVQTLGRAPAIWAMARDALLGRPRALTCAYGGAPVSGHIVASTLSLLPLLIDTPYMPDLKGAILCVEDINEEISAIDRMFLYLKNRGVFDSIAALVCGEFTNLTDSGRPFGFAFDEIARYHAGALPLALNAPFGHGDVFYPLPIGRTGRLENNTLSFM